MAIAVERVETESRLAHQALHDALTGLPSRTLLLDQIVAMTHEERIAFADALEARFRDALRRVGGKPDGDRRPND